MKICMESNHAVRIRFGAWHQERELCLSFPEGWKVHTVAPKDGTSISDDAVQQAFLNPIGISQRLPGLARGKRTAIIAVDDITRPTPVHRFLSYLIKELVRGGIQLSNISILIGTAAHRPPAREEIRRKLTPEIADSLNVIVHDFLGSDICRVGWIKGGPVHLNRHFLQADLRVLVGCVVPHNETGFGGGAKMVVPGVAGHLTIAHLHGALPPRPAGQLESINGAFDRRAWAEEVARRVGVDAVVCAVINSSRRLAGLYVGDLVKAHRAAARLATEVGQSFVSSDLAYKCDIVLVNSYPLDTDPMQMGKSLNIAKELSPKCIVAINAASDGIFYHGMGMGSGISIQRLFRNLPCLLSSPQKVWTWLRSAAYAMPRPVLFARLCYFFLNNLSYSSFKASEGQLAPDVDVEMRQGKNASLLLFSPKFPAWGFRRRYPKGILYRNWHELCVTLSERFPTSPNILLFPCAPLQLLYIT